MNDHMVLTIEARIAEFEKALEEQFKPALAKAISEVVDDFLKDTEGEFFKITTTEVAGDE